MKTIILFLISLCVAMTAAAQCVSAGPFNGSTFTNDGTIGTSAWQNLANAQTPNSIFTTAGQTVAILSTANTNYLVVSNLGFSIPVSSTICGITVDIQKNAAGLLIGSSIKDNVVKIVQGGVISGTNYANAANWGASSSYTSYGGGTDLWGTTWTAPDINAANFGVAISAKLSAGLAALFLTAQVDHIQVTVHYTFSILPVALKSFTGKPVNNGVQLQWVTAAETNNKNFILQRSVDNHTWINIDSVPASGNSGVEKTYTAFDPLPAAINYYRLLQMDLNGGNSLSDVIVVKSPALPAASVSVYPNPASAVVHINSAEAIRSVRFFTAIGAEVFPPLNGSSSTGRLYAVSRLSAGVYYVRIGIGDRVVTEKIVVSK